MAERYKVQVGDEIIEFEGPEGLSEVEIEDLAYEQLGVPTIVGGSVRDPESSGAFGSFARGLPQEALFNFADEIIAAGNAAIPGLAELDEFFGMVPEQQGPLEGGDFWDRLKNNLENVREQYSADEALHPVPTNIGKIGGVLATLPRAGAAVASRLPAAITQRAAARPILTATGLGAAGGAVSGAGAGEEGTRAQSAALGGLTGAVLGGGIAGGLELAPAIANYAKIFFNQAGEKEAVGQIIKALQRDGFDVTSPAGVQKLKAALEEYTGKPVSLADIGGAVRSRTGVGLRAPSEAQQPAIDAVRSRQSGQGQRIATDIRANVAPRTDVHAIDEDLVAQRASEAERLRQRALFEQGRAPKGEFSRTTQMDDPDLGRLDVINYKAPSGEQVEGTLAFHPDLDEANLELFGPDGLYSPGFEGAGRIGPSAVRDLLSHIRTEYPDISRIVSERVSGARKAAGVHGGVDVPMDKIPPFMSGGRQSRIVEDPELQQLVRLPDAQRALTKALERAESERALLAATGQSIDHLPDLSRGSDLDVRTLDYLKRFLDDEVNSLYRRGVGSTFAAGEAAQVKALRDTIREKMRTAVPEYGEYLDAYKGSSEMIDSLEAGRTFDNLDPEIIAREQAERSTAGQELYRVGVARNLLDVIKGSKDTSNPASRILNSPEAREQLLATGVDPAAAARLNRSVSQERTLNLLPEELAGAQTAQRAMAQADANAGADLAVPFNPGSPLGWAGMVGRTILNRTSVNRNELVNNELLPRLVETDPKIVGGIVNELEAQGQTQLANELRLRLRQIKSGLLGGALIGGPVALPALEE